MQRWTEEELDDELQWGEFSEGNSSSSHSYGFSLDNQQDTITATDLAAPYLSAPEHHASSIKTTQCSTTLPKSPQYGATSLETPQCGASSLKTPQCSQRSPGARVLCTKPTCTTCVMYKGYLNPLPFLSSPSPVYKTGFKSPRVQGWNVKLI